MKISQIADKILNTAQQISFTQYLFEKFLLQFNEIFLLPIEAYKFAWLIWLLNFWDVRENEKTWIQRVQSWLIAIGHVLPPNLRKKIMKKLWSITCRKVILEFLEGDSLTRKSDAQNKILVISAKHNFRHPTETSLSVHTVGTCSKFHW